MDFDLNIESLESLDGIEVNEEVEPVETLDNLDSDDEDLDEEDTPQETLDTDEEEPQESVGNEEDDDEPQEPDEDGSSQFYSSIAEALSGDGVLTSLTEEDIKDIKDPESFLKAIDKQIESRFDEQQKRVLEVLNYKVEPSKISVYENTLKYLHSISEEDIKKEENEELRKNLIYQVAINRGKSKERALKEVERAFDRGDDVEDALEALKEHLEYYQESYDNEIASAKKAKEEEDKAVKERAENIQKVFDEKKFYEELGVSPEIGKKAFINATNASYRDPDTGEMITAIQKAQKEDEANFLRGLGVAFTLTNGFKDFSKLFKGAVNKQVNKKVAELQNKITPPSQGGIKYVGNNKKKKLTQITL